jgi:integrase
MSALPPKADIRGYGFVCPLSAKSRHSLTSIIFYIPPYDLRNPKAPAATRAIDGTFYELVSSFICSPGRRLAGIVKLIWHAKAADVAHICPALLNGDETTICAAATIIAKENGLVTANRARSTLSSLFAWAIGEGLCESNPIIGTNVQEETARRRVLTDADLAAIWKAAPDDDYGRIVKLLTLTGQRREEIGALRWSEIDMNKKLITLSASRTKNGVEHQIPLSDAAMMVLKTCCRDHDLLFGLGPNGFAGWSRSKLALDAACGVKDWTIHDLRRTVATRMADIGIQPHVIEAVLNHVSGHKAGGAGIYNRSTYAAEKRAALDAWANHLAVAIAQANGANVTKLERKA